jgi:hypothetical protein
MKMSTKDARYQRYADLFENPETAESIELGARVLHWVFMENFDSLRARLVVTQHAQEAKRP